MVMCSIDLEQNTPEWLEFRRTRLGASDACIIMGVSPWNTPYQLWEQKVGLKENDATNDAMRRGTQMEDEARQAFIKETGIFIKPKVKVSKNHEWIIASLDGIDAEEKNIV